MLSKYQVQIIEDNNFSPGKNKKINRGSPNLGHGKDTNKNTNSTIKTESFM